MPLLPHTEASKSTNMKAGTKVALNFIMMREGAAKEIATIARVTKRMLPMPDGYLPVRFSDGGVLLIHKNQIEVVPA